jgi:hypothetical protein
MFIKTHKDSNITLTFLKSACVQAYPCGRRRSTPVDRDGDVGTVNDQYYFPFDPEARLNTEANHRRQSGLNGYTQTYLKDWDKKNKLLTLSLAGYLFTINIDFELPKVEDQYGTELERAYNFVEETDFGDKIAKLAGGGDAVYANIVLEDIHLFSGFKEYYTRVLRDQLGSDDVAPSTQLDLLKADSGIDVNNFDNYYFSGLSFSTTPLVSVGQAAGYTPTTRDTSIKTEVGNRKATQEIVSLCILKKNGNSWEINQEALLPNIEHDVLENSVKMGEAHVSENLTVDHNATITNDFTITDRVEVTSGSTKIKNELIVENDVYVENNTIKTENLTATETVLAKNIGTDNKKIVKITATEAEIDTLNANDIQQKVEGLTDIPENHYDIPVMFIKQVGNEHQLQITRVNRLN